MISIFCSEIYNSQRLGSVLADLQEISHASPGKLHIGKIRKNTIIFLSIGILLSVPPMLASFISGSLQNISQHLNAILQFWSPILTFLFKCRLILFCYLICRMFEVINESLVTITEELKQV